MCVWSEKLSTNLKICNRFGGRHRILAFPNFDVSIIIQGVVSKKAVVGACLQGDHAVFENKAKVHPVSFFGSKLTLSSY